MRTFLSHPFGHLLMKLFSAILFVPVPFLVTGYFALAGELPTSTPAAEGLSAEKLEQVHEIMNGLVRDRKITGGSVLIARHGKVVFHEPYGVMHLDYQRPVQRDTIFRIYSMSKAITSAAALILVEEGKIDLDTPRVAVSPAVCQPPGVRRRRNPPGKTPTDSN